MSLPPLAPFVRSRPATALAPVRRHTLTTWLVGAVIFAFLSAAPGIARAYVFEGASWPASTTVVLQLGLGDAGRTLIDGNTDRKSTRLNSSHSQISYAVFCLKKKKNYT